MGCQMVINGGPESGRVVDIPIAQDRIDVYTVDPDRNLRKLVYTYVRGPESRTKPGTFLYEWEPAPKGQRWRKCPEYIWSTNQEVPHAEP